MQAFTTAHRSRIREKRFNDWAGEGACQTFQHPGVSFHRPTLAHGGYPWCVVTYNFTGRTYIQAQDLTKQCAVSGLPLAELQGVGADLAKHPVISSLSAWFLA